MYNIYAYMHTVIYLYIYGQFLCDCWWCKYVTLTFLNDTHKYPSKNNINSKAKYLSIRIKGDP